MNSFIIKSDKRQLTRRNALQGAAFFFGTSSILLTGRPAVASTAVGLTCVAQAVDTNQPKPFSLNFVPSTNRWTQGETGSTSEVFRAKSGTYNVVALTTYLMDTTGKQVAILRNLNPDTAIEGEHGNDGKALETARIFEWKVEIVVK